MSDKLLVFNVLINYLFCNIMTNYLLQCSDKLSVLSVLQCAVKLPELQCADAGVLPDAAAATVLSLQLVF